MSEELKDTIITNPELSGITRGYHKYILIDKKDAIDHTNAPRPISCNELYKHNELLLLE